MRKALNTLKKYSDNRKNSFILYFHLDDMHWNKNGVELIGRHVVVYIKINTD